MTTAAMAPEFAAATNLAALVSQAADRVEELTPEQLSTWTSGCDFLRGLFAQARRSIEDGLSQGVDAKVFAAKYEQGIADLEAVLTMTQRIVTRAWTSALPQPAEQFVARYRDLMDDLLDLHQFLAGVVATAKMPHCPVDWQRVREAKAAYERGETKPFQRSAKG